MGEKIEFMFKFIEIFIDEIKMRDALKKAMPIAVFTQVVYIYLIDTPEAKKKNKQHICLYFIFAVEDFFVVVVVLVLY